MIDKQEFHQFLLLTFFAFLGGLTRELNDLISNKVNFKNFIIGVVTAITTGVVFGKVSVVNGAITNEIDNIDKKTVSILADTIKKAANDYKNKLKQSTISTNANINTTDPDSITQLLNVNSEILHELRAIRHLLEKDS